MAAELKQLLGQDAELIEGGGGIFQVRIDDRLIFDKEDLGRFPDPGELETLLEG